MNIGELARHTGVSIRSLRYYETKQLLTSHRGENGYRVYDQAAIERVKMIQHYLSLRLSTDEIFSVVFCSRPDDLASFCDGNDLPPCPDDQEFYQEKLAEVEEQIAALETARTYLKQRLERCQSPKDM
jgi:MerR family transcriptional regulator, Zn(II)-responsive regulator of zntA